jgi:hypothetical protein
MPENMEACRILAIQNFSQVNLLDEEVTFTILFNLILLVVFALK